MELLISLLVVVLILGLVYWALNAVPLPQPVRVVAIVIVAIIGIIALLRFLPVGHLS